MTTLPPRLHAAAALMLGLLVIGLPLIVLVIPAWQERALFRERRNTLEEQSSRYLSLAAQTPMLKKSVEQLLAQSADRSGFLQETSPALAAAALQRKIQTLIEAQGGKVQSAQSIPDTGKGMFPAVTIRVQANVSLDALGSMFGALTQDPLLLEADNVFVQTRYAGGQRPASEGVNLLEIRLDVTGYLYEVENP